MIVDEFEPTEIERLIKLTLPDTTREQLNRKGFADYMWLTVWGKYEQAERKQTSELLSKMEATEYQLGDQIRDCPYPNELGNLMLIVEGGVKPTSSGVRSFNGGRHRDYKITYDRYEAWLIAQERAGIMVWKTFNQEATAKTLIHFAKSALRPEEEHTALRRYLKLRQIGANKLDPQVQTLMGIADAEIGPELAKELILTWGSVWNVVRQTPEDLAQYTGNSAMGLVRAKRLLEAIGRHDI